METISTQHRARAPKLEPLRKNSKLGLWSVLWLFIVLIIMFCVAVLLYRQKEQKPILPIGEVIMRRSLVYADSEEILKTINERYRREDMLRINPRKVAEDLEKIDWIKSVIVRKKWFNKLEVEIEERNPVLRWGEKGEYIDDEAKRFVLPESPSLKTMFMVSGPQGSERRVLDMYKIISSWFVRQEIELASLRLDVHNIWHIETKEGVDVTIGREHFNNRMKKFTVVYNTIIKPYHRYIEAVDLRYNEGFSVRWKNGVMPNDIANKIPTAAAN
ncbi:MAG: FtsQ-type POTRA domain-containing protein [Cardiobacteriaceae bacterium]|nr:FtsQ-type POTRA domain-containing protein [Cardiobacteriaceae bacterium]